MNLTAENAESAETVQEEISAATSADLRDLCGEKERRVCEMGREAAAGADALLQAAKVRTMATPEKVALFADCLRGRGWLTAKAIEAESGLGDRLLRALAEASDGEIISGQLGYRLTCEETLPEMDAAEGWLRSQAKKMTARAVQIRVARNRRRDLTTENAESTKELLNSERREVFPDAPLRPI